LPARVGHMISVKVKGVGLDPDQNPLLLLIDQEETLILPIGIGLSEAQAISLKLEGQALPRPLTHDLILNILNHLEATLHKIVVNDIQDGTYYAQVYVEKDDQLFEIDARPSDGVALAISSNVPLFIADKVAEQSLPFEDVLKENLDSIFDSVDDDEDEEDEDRPLH